MDESKTRKVVTNMKKLLSAMLVLALVATIGLFAVSCLEPDPLPAETASVATSYVVIDINPSVELTISSENVVLSAGAINDDAEVLLSQVTIVGTDVEEASEVLADASVELGFISEEDNAEISITICGETVEIEDEVFNKIKDKFCEHVKEKCNFNLGVEKDVLLSLKTELEALKAENPENEAIQKLNIAHYRMIVSAMEKDETLTLEVALSMSTKQLVDIIKESTLKQIDKELEKVRREAEQEMKELEDSVYKEIDNVLVKAHATAISALRKIEHHLEILEDYDLKHEMTLTLTAAQVEEIASMLGLTGEEATAFVEKCCGLDGTYTLKNIECSINRLYRNTTAAEREAFEEKYELVEEYIETLEETMTVPGKYVEQVKSAAEQVKKMLNNETLVIPETVTTYEELDELIDAIEDMIEDKIEALEEEIEDIIEEYGLKDAYEAEAERIKDEYEAAEERLEDEYERYEEECERRHEENINNWMNRYQNGHENNP